LKFEGVGAEAEDLEGMNEFDEVALRLRGVGGGCLEVREDGTRERELRGKVGWFVGERSGLSGGSYRHKRKKEEKSKRRIRGFGRG